MAQLSALLKMMTLLVFICLAAPPPEAAVTASVQNPQAEIAGCPLFPEDNVWNTPIDTLPVDPRSSDYIRSIGEAIGLHPDFGAGEWDGHPIGIPYNVVPGDQPRVPVSFTWPGESDPGPYPIPANPAVEGGSDSHLLIVDQDHCVLYELFAVQRQGNGAWHAGSGAIFDLNSNALRPSGWTSADAAGLPILAGLVRYEEVAAGVIDHALRFTASHTRDAYIWPARHAASDIISLRVPPMGQRFRLKASFDISGFSPQSRAILIALKKYGLILADNGSNWYITGAPDSRWDNDSLVSELARVKGTDFEAVDESSLMIDPDSGQARQFTGIPRLWLPVLTRETTIDGR